MVYRKPFTRRQRREAIREYESFRHHILLLLATAAPTNDQQREVLRRYREYIRGIRKALESPDQRVPVLELNENIQQAKLTVAEYFSVRYFGK